MQGMRDLLRSSLGRSLRELSAEDKLAAAWPIACGSALAAHGVVGEFGVNGVLHVAVSSVDWMQPFLAVRSALANDLSKIAGVRVSEIHFTVRPQSPGVKHE